VAPCFLPLFLVPAQAAPLCCALQIAPGEAVKALAATLDSADADKLAIVGVLGKGSYGTVYQGKWRGLGVAVKTLVFSSAGEGGSRGVSSYEAAVNEAALCTRLSHRNVVATYHYDVKRIAVANGVGASPAGKAGARGGELQVEMGPQAAAQGAKSSERHMAGPQEFKLYLVQELCETTLAKAYRASVGAAKVDCTHLLLSWGQTQKQMTATLLWSDADPAGAQFADVPLFCGWWLTAGATQPRWGASAHDRRHV
jgi:hypothetical protein